jgi:hypothetical protein
MSEQGGRITRVRDWVVGIAGVIAAVAAVLSVPDHSVSNLSTRGNNQSRSSAPQNLSPSVYTSTGSVVGRVNQSGTPGQAPANQTGSFTAVTPTSSSSILYGPQDRRPENGISSVNRTNGGISPTSGIETVSNQPAVGNGSGNEQRSSAQLVTRYIAEHQEPSGCGTLPEVYCEADIVRAAERYALQVGNGCDIGNGGSETCPIDPEAVVIRKEREIELQALERKRATLESQLSSVYLSPPSSFYQDTELCKRKALNSGLRNEVYQQYVTSTCLPEARAARAKPLKDLLDRVDAKISQINR